MADTHSTKLNPHSKIYGIKIYTKNKNNLQLNYTLMYEKDVLDEDARTFYHKFKHDINTTNEPLFIQVYMECNFQSIDEPNFKWFLIDEEEFIYEILNKLE